MIAERLAKIRSDLKSLKICPSPKAGLHSET
jgi:hypothetical protein